MSGAQPAPATDYAEQGHGPEVRDDAAHDLRPAALARRNDPPPFDCSARLSQQTGAPPRRPGPRRSEIGRRGLEDYYAAKGEAPGRWAGSGLVGIDGLESGDPVTSEQMRNLFGAGRHPLIGVALGAAYRVYDSDGGGFNAEVARRLDARADDSTEPADQLAQVAAARSEVAREFFVREQGREPRDARELASAVARYSRPQRTAVAGYDLTFSPVKSVSTLWAIALPGISRAVADA